jgi:iron complex outermembrane recepter protein
MKIKLPGRLKIESLVLILFTNTILQQKVYTQEAVKSDTIKQLKEIIITSQINKLTPLTFQNLAGDELRLKSTGQEPSFLLAEMPSITFHSEAGNSQGYSYFRIRGIDQSRIIMTLDGVPLHEGEDNGTFFTGFPDVFNAVSKVEIQRGVGTSNSGLSSYGGNINLFSKQLSDSAGAALGIAYGSYNSARVFGEYNTGIKNRKGLYIRATGIHSDGYKYKSMHNSQSVFLSSGLFYDKSVWKFNFLLGHHKNQLSWLGVPDSLISIDRKTNANRNENDNFLNCYLQLHHNWLLKKNNTIQTCLYYYYNRGNYDFDQNNFFGLPTTNELFNYALQYNMVGILSNYTFTKRNFNWTTGIHGSFSNRQHTGSERKLGKLYENTGYKNEINYFTKADYKINKLTLFADVQLRNATFDYRGNVSFKAMNWHFLNPKAGISINNKNSVFYYSIGRTEREPTRTDLFEGNDNLQADNLGNAIVANKVPEQVLSQELGFRYLSKSLKINANLYYMSFDNELVLDGKFGTNAQALTNKVDRSFRTGFELTLTYQVNKVFSLVNNSSFNYSSIKVNNEIFTPILTPAVILNQECIYANNKFSGGFSARYQDKSFIDFKNTATIKGFFLLNARIQYEIQKLHLGLFLYNITNTKYFSNGYVDYNGVNKYLVQSPTTFSLSVQYNF